MFAADSEEIYLARMSKSPSKFKNRHQQTFLPFTPTLPTVPTKQPTKKSTLIKDVSGTYLLHLSSCNFFRHLDGPHVIGTAVGTAAGA